jgi:hypothetical protein
LALRRAEQTPALATRGGIRRASVGMPKLALARALGRVSAKTASFVASRTQRSYSNSPARRRREQTRDPLLTEQHNWNAFLDSAAKAEERAWLDYMRRLFSDATAKIDAVE